ncbi:MAG: chorismate mutase, partial [Woeseiaceae bacterium]
MNLDELRSSISSIDQRLLELIAERQQLAGEIGRSKQATGRATRDFEREKDVLDMARQKAEAISIDPNIAEEIMRTLIRSSLTSQERDRVVAEGKGNGRRVLVIGGAGKMGAWFVDFFASQGFATS